MNQIVKITLIVLFFFTAILTSKAQPNAEIGFLGGISYYLGDVNPSKQFYSQKFAFGGLYRYYFDDRYALKFTAIKATLSGSDLDFSNGYQQQRGYEFNTSVTDFALQLEFSFFAFSLIDEKTTASPYISGGIGGYLGPSKGSPFQFSLPFGGGFKFKITERISAGLEWSFRKTFSDYLDELEAEFPDQKQQAYSNQNDWYSFAGLSIAYKFYQGKMYCPAYGGSFKINK